MNWLKKHLGMCLMLLGTVLLCVLHVLHLTFVSVLLLVPLCLIVAGLLLHVWALKRESCY